MEDRFNLLKILYEAIENEMMQYSKELEEQLIKKYEEEFEEKIIGNFIDEYLAGRTPNPCDQIELEYSRDLRSVIPNITIKL